MQVKPLDESGRQVPGSEQHGRQRLAPLILTAKFDDLSFRRFDEVRRRHFPVERNFIPAHLTLFHHLPGERLSDVVAVASTHASEEGAIPLSVNGVRFMGQGSAFVVESPELVRLRAALAAQWSVDLTKQDSQAFRPHVTIQNKVPTAVAKALFDEMTTAFRPFDAMATGLLLWHYRDGPWEAAGEFPFRAVGKWTDRSENRFALGRVS